MILLCKIMLGKVKTRTQYGSWVFIEGKRLYYYKQATVNERFERKYEAFCG